MASMAADHDDDPGAAAAAGQAWMRSELHGVMAAFQKQAERITKQDAQLAELAQAQQALLNETRSWPDLYTGMKEIGNTLLTAKSDMDKMKASFAESINSKDKEIS